MRIIINGQAYELDPATTLADAVAVLLDSPDGRGVAAALDGEVVPRAQWRRTKLSDGDRVELVVAVQGG